MNLHSFGRVDVSSGCVRLPSGIDERMIRGRWVVDERRGDKGTGRDLPKDSGPDPLGPATSPDATTDWKNSLSKGFFKV